MRSWRAVGAIPQPPRAAQIALCRLRVWSLRPGIPSSPHRKLARPPTPRYYQGDTSPHESGQPKPLNFLTVPPTSKFVFHVQRDLPFLARIAPELARDEQWQRPIKAAMAHAFEWLGFGAKTAVGYGAMTSDARAQANAEQARDEAVTRAALDALSPASREVAEFIAAMQQRGAQLKGRKDKPTTDLHQRAQKLAAKALGTQWSATEQAAAADAIELWLPQVVALPDAKDAFKKMKLRTLRGLA